MDADAFLQACIAGSVAFGVAYIEITSQHFKRIRALALKCKSVWAFLTFRTLSGAILAGLIGGVFAGFVPAKGASVAALLGTTAGPWLIPVYIGFSTRSLLSSRLKDLSPAGSHGTLTLPALEGWLTEHLQPERYVVLAAAVAPYATRYRNEDGSWDSTAARQVLLRNWPPFLKGPDAERLKKQIAGEDWVPVFLAAFAAEAGLGVLDSVMKPSAS